MKSSVVHAAEDAYLIRSDPIEGGAETCKLARILATMREETTVAHILDEVHGKPKSTGKPVREKISGYNLY